MTELLPTKDGDAVIAYRTSKPNLFHVWFALRDRQQASSDILAPSIFKDPAAAEHFARMAVTENNGRVFRVEQDEGVWEELQLS